MRTSGVGDPIAYSQLGTIGDGCFVRITSLSPGSPLGRSVQNPENLPGYVRCR
jgi:hypothetical protein